MADLDYYQILGVDYNAEHEAIKKAYRQLLEQSKNDPAMRQQVLEAWQILGAPHSRADYDKKINAARRHRAPNPASGRQESGSGSLPPSGQGSGADQTRRMQPQKTDVGDFSPSGQGGAGSQTIRMQPQKTDVGEVSPSGQGGAGNQTVRLQPQKTDVGEVSPSGQGGAVDQTIRLQPQKTVVEPDPSPLGPGRVSDQTGHGPPTVANVVMVEVQGPDGVQTKLPLPAGDHVIGRGDKPACRIALKDTSERFISRHHATLRVSPQGCSILDHSTNGTRVNGNKIPTKNWVELKDEDEVRIEFYTLTIRRISPKGPEQK